MEALKVSLFSLSPVPPQLEKVPDRHTVPQSFASIRPFVVETKRRHHDSHPIPLRHFGTWTVAFTCLRFVTMVKLINTSKDHALHFDT